MYFLQKFIKLDLDLVSWGKPQNPMKPFYFIYNKGVMALIIN